MEPGQCAWSGDGIYCTQGFLSFKVLNSDSHTFVGVDMKKHPSQNLQETNWEEAGSRAQMHKIHRPEPGQTEQGKGASHPKAF